MHFVITIPNILSGLRLLSVPVLLMFAYAGYEQWFILLLVFAFMTDALDGYIARHYHQKTRVGAQLDSWADFAIYMTIPIAGWLLWPEVVMRERIFVGLIIASVLLPVVLGLLKFKTLTSYHTWLVKFAAISMAVTSLYLFLGGVALPFQVATLLCVLAACEEMILTIMLNRPRSNVRSLWHALKIKKSKKNNLRKRA